VCYLCTDSDVATADDDKANSDFFADVYTCEPVGEFNELPFRYLTTTCNEVIFSDEIILDKLHDIKINKSVGPDMLHPRILHEVRHQLVTPLRLLFKTSYKTGSIPQDWKNAHTVPIYRKGSKAEVKNYRPVSLTSVVCKVMESIIMDHVIAYFIENELFSSKQYGFLKGRSTVLQ